MADNSSATVRETPHANQTSRTNTIINALKQRAQAVLNDRSIDPGESCDYSLRFGDERSMACGLVRRADAGETVIDEAGFLKTCSTDEEKVQH